MVYRRRRRFKRRFRRRFGRRGYKRIKKVIRRTVNNMAETHSATLTLNTAFGSIGYTWQELLCFPSQGGLSTQIIGRRYEIIGFSLWGTLSGGQTNTVADDRYNVVRMVAAVFDGDTAGTAPGSKWPNMSSGGAATPIRLKSPIWPNDGSTQWIRRKVKDKLWTLTSPGRDSTGYMPVLKNVSFKHRFKKPLIVNYCNESGGLKADKVLAIGVCSDSSAVPAPGFVNGTLTWYWKDL